MIIGFHANDISLLRVIGTRHNKLPIVFDFEDTEMAFMPSPEANTDYQERRDYSIPGVIFETSSPEATQKPAILVIGATGVATSSYARIFTDDEASS